LEREGEYKRRKGTQYPKLVVRGEPKNFLIRKRKSKSTPSILEKGKKERDKDYKREA